MKKVTIVKFLSKKGKVIEMDKSKVALDADTVIIDEYTVEIKDKQEFVYPMIMKHLTTGNIIEFTSLDCGVWLKNGLGVRVIGSIVSGIIPHTNDEMESYNPVCDHKLDGYYVEASIEALCALKVLGYKDTTSANITKDNYYYCVGGTIEAYTGMNWCLKCKPMDFKDGKFITEPEKPKFEVGQYIKIRGTGYIFQYKEGMTVYVAREANYYMDTWELWNIEGADPESYVHVWNNRGSTILVQANGINRTDWDNIMPDIDGVAERLGLK